MFEEAEPEFHTMAFFKTTIRVRNALQDEMVPQVSSDQEALLIHLSRPIMLAQPAAFDKGLSVCLCVCLLSHLSCTIMLAQPASFDKDLSVSLCVCLSTQPLVLPYYAGPACHL